jgi:hypothetical protein
MKRNTELLDNNIHLIFFTSFGIYLSSFWFDYIIFEYKNPRVWASGFDLLRWGWLLALYGYYSWIANPLLILSWFFLLNKRYIISSIFSFIALVLIIRLVFVTTMIVEPFPESVYCKIIRYGDGYILWFISVLVIMVGDLRLVCERY